MLVPAGRQEPEYDKLTVLDKEMMQILKNKSLSTLEKVKLYHQTLQKNLAIEARLKQKSTPGEQMPQQENTGRIPEKRLSNVNDELPEIDFLSAIEPDEDDDDQRGNINRQLKLNDTMSYQPEDVARTVKGEKSRHESTHDKSLFSDFFKLLESDVQLQKSEKKKKNQAKSIKRKLKIKTQPKTKSQKNGEDILKTDRKTRKWEPLESYNTRLAVQNQAFIESESDSDL